MMVDDIDVDHTFVIPVYRSASSHLAALIASLHDQRPCKSRILLTTSTPSPELELFAARHNLTLFINPQRVDIATDWNFAVAAARTRFVTLAHQDDLFAPDYASRMTGALYRYPEAVIAFCDYSEHTEAGPRLANINLRVKRELCRRTFGKRECITDLREKVHLLSLGNPICCPSVMLNRALLQNFCFPTGFSTNLDWMAWLELARVPGGFVYLRDRLVSKGIHQSSETTATIANRARQREDRQLFECFWPRPVAAILAAIYRLSYRNNRLSRTELAETHTRPEHYQQDPDPLQRRQGFAVDQPADNASSMK